MRATWLAASPSCEDFRLRLRLRGCQSTMSAVLQGFLREPVSGPRGVARGGLVVRVLLAWRRPHDMAGTPGSQRPGDVCSSRSERIGGDPPGPDALLARIALAEAWAALSTRKSAVRDLRIIRTLAQRPPPSLRGGSATAHSWAFGQLRQFVVGKAKWAGVPLLFVDAHDTSQACSCCGGSDRWNRPDQATFPAFARMFFRRARLRSGKVPPFRQGSG